MVHYYEDVPGISEAQACKRLAEKLMRVLRSYWQELALRGGTCYIVDYVGKTLARDRNVINDTPVCQEGSEDSEISDWTDYIGYVTVDSGCFPVPRTVMLVDM